MAEAFEAEEEFGDYYGSDEDEYDLMDIMGGAYDGGRMRKRERV
jgi:hypothetical protein